MNEKVTALAGTNSGESTSPWVAANTVTPRPNAGNAGKRRRRRTPPAQVMAISKTLVIRATAAGKPTTPAAAEFEPSPKAIRLLADVQVKAALDYLKSWDLFRGMKGRDR